MQQVQRQALAGIAEGGRGLGFELLGQGSFAAGAEAVCAALLGILHDMTKAVIIAEALEDKVPQRYQRRKGPLVKGFLGERKPGGQQGYWQKLAEVAQELAGGKAGAQQLGRLGLGLFGLLARGLCLWGRLSGTGF
jgi:hypothetical protein